MSLHWNGRDLEKDREGGLVSKCYFQGREPDSGWTDVHAGYEISDITCSGGVTTSHVARTLAAKQFA